jgi:hypothetical protein
MEGLLRVAIVAFIVVGALPQAVQGQQGSEKFAGTWVLDLKRSESLEQSNATPKETIVITSKGDALQIESTRGHYTEMIRYTNGSLETLGTAGTAGAGSPPRMGVILKWDASELRTATPMWISETPITVVETRRLSRDGMEMTIETRVDVQHGYQGGTTNYSPPVKDVYTRKAN